MLVRSCRTVSPLPVTPAQRPPPIGGLFSVALSCGSPRLAVSQHPALRSPDLPRQGANSTFGLRLAATTRPAQSSEATLPSSQRAPIATGRQAKAPGRADLAVPPPRYPCYMRTVVLGPPPAELQALIARRHSLGLDGFDEVWKGEYHMAPMAHPFHGYLFQEVSALLRPLARTRRLD